MVSGRRRGARASAYQTEPLDPAIIVERIVALQDVENRVRRIEGIVGVFVGLGATSLAAPDFRGAFVTFVTSLGSPEVTLRKPIPVTIVPDGDEFTASFMDANISSGGGSPQEALYNLQHLIAAFFLLDEEEPTELLSGRMRHQRQVLAECVCRISRETMPNE